MKWRSPHLTGLTTRRQHKVRHLLHVQLVGNSVCREGEGEVVEEEEEVEKEQKEVGKEEESKEKKDREKEKRRRGKRR